jgi:hypothetical protein
VTPVLLNHDQLGRPERAGKADREAGSDDKSGKAGHVSFQLTKGKRYMIV